MELQGISPLSILCTWWEATRTMAMPPHEANCPGLLTSDGAQGSRMTVRICKFITVYLQFSDHNYWQHTDQSRSLNPVSVQYFRNTVFSHSVAHDQRRLGPARRPPPARTLPPESSQSGSATIVVKGSGGSLCRFMCIIVFVPGDNHTQK